MGRAFGVVATVISTALVAGVTAVEPARRLYVFHTHPTWSPGGLQILYERRVATCRSTRSRPTAAAFAA